MRILNSLKIPYRSSVPFTRDEWHCPLHMRKFDSLEEAKEHVRQRHPNPEEPLKQMIYEVDLLAWNSEAIEIWGAGTSSFNPDRLKFFKENHPEIRFHYFSNATLEHHPEEFEAYLSLLKRLREYEGRPH